MRALLLVGLCGCEAVFGVGYQGPDSTVDAGDEADASDAMTPGSTCPPPDMGLAPLFQGSAIEAQLGCTFYTEVADGTQASALCGTTFATGSPGSLLLPAVWTGRDGFRILEAHIAPAGDELFVVETDRPTGRTTPVELAIYRWDADTTSWLPGETTPFAGQHSPGSHVSAPTARVGSAQRVLVNVIEEDSLTLEEWERANPPESSWQLQRAETASDLGVAFAWAHLSADGLRMVFTGAPVGSSQVRVYYRDRSDWSRPFGAPVELTTLAAEWGTPYLTEDCSRLYFTRGGTTYRLER